MNDTRLKYDYEYDVLYCDIEAATTDGKFAELGNENAFISIIQMCHHNVKTNTTKFILYTLNKYKDQYNYDHLKSIFGDIEIIHFKTEQNVACAFFWYLQDLDKTTIVTFFCGSGTVVKCLTKTEEAEQETNWFFHALKSKKQRGYDLPFIIERSKLILTTTESVKTYESDLFVQTKTIKELPACIFIDSMYLLVVKRLPDQKNNMKSNELNAFCKLHNVQ